jgi:hypothetical protein
MQLKHVARKPLGHPRQRHGMVAADRDDDIVGREVAARRRDRESPPILGVRDAPHFDTLAQRRREERDVVVDVADDLVAVGPPRDEVHLRHGRPRYAARAARRTRADAPARKPAK